jgi:hypothetical protein
MAPSGISSADCNACSAMIEPRFPRRGIASTKTLNATDLAIQLLRLADVPLNPRDRMFHYFGLRAVVGATILHQEQSVKLFRELTESVASDQKTPSRDISITPFATAILSPASAAFCTETKFSDDNPQQKNRHFWPSLIPCSDDVGARFIAPAFQIQSQSLSLFQG